MHNQATSQVSPKAFPVMSNPQDSQHNALHSLLAMMQPLKAFVSTVEAHYLGQQDDWQALLIQGQQMREQLNHAPTMVSELLEYNPGTSRIKTVSYIASIIKEWPQHRKRHEYMTLFETYEIDARIVDAIDETLTEDEGNLLNLLKLDLRNELRVMLEVQVNHFDEVLIAGLESAQSEADKHAAMLAILPHDPSQAVKSDDLMFDVFQNSIMSANDLELTVAAIATFVLLKRL